jgi:hypothetical protein
VLFAVLFAWLVLAELPTPIQLVGGVLIVAGLVAVRADEAREQSRTDRGGVGVGASDEEDYASELLPTGALGQDPVRHGS